MKTSRNEVERFAKYAALEVMVVTAAVLCAWLLPGTPEGRVGAGTGVLVSGATAAVVLLLKRWALPRSAQAAWAVVGVGFGLRLFAVILGGAVVVWQQAGSGAFVVGFFGVYFLCQWLEVSYILASRVRGQGGV